MIYIQSSRLISRWDRRQTRPQQQNKSKDEMVADSICINRLFNFHGHVESKSTIFAFDSKIACHTDWVHVSEEHALMHNRVYSGFNSIHHNDQYSIFQIFFHMQCSLCLKGVHLLSVRWACTLNGHYLLMKSSRREPKSARMSVYILFILRTIKSVGIYSIVVTITWCRRTLFGLLL